MLTVLIQPFATFQYKDTQNSLNNQLYSPIFQYHQSMVEGNESIIHE